MGTSGWIMNEVNYSLKHLFTGTGNMVVIITVHKSEILQKKVII